MANPEVHLLFHQPINDHCFSADRSLLAVAKDTTVELYSKSGKGYTLQEELVGHDKTVTSVDIAPNTGRIVTCSQGELLPLNTKMEKDIHYNTYRFYRIRDANFMKL